MARQTDSALLHQKTLIFHGQTMDVLGRSE